ncbi:hypothetical protein MN116_001373 [Schistosoma mekongi]|uniref:Mannosyltransferase n=1 Tax=Schistosoma mekongi TaxID=38744 RepID=A0AAE2D9K6_SCHME|nr:hypothetical protein MN116_001373 [Schistosoma mekongi]
MKHLSSLTFKIALAVNTFSVLFNVINDCDETYNYWEPLHFIATNGEGGGFQTWEYSPSFGLRSYLYLWLFGWPSYLSFLIGLPNWVAFLLVRLLLGLVSAFSISLLSSTVATCVLKKNHKQTGELDSAKQKILLSFLLSFCCCVSPGNFLSSTTILPSGPSASLSALMLSFWLKRRYFLAIGCVAFTGLVVWPFAAILGIPLALYMVYSGDLYRLVKFVILWTFILIPPLALVDSFYFGRFILAPFNILWYNLFPHSRLQNGSASQLYGTEPISFYLKNYILNQNLLCILALLLSVISTLKCISRPLFRTKTVSESNFSDKHNISRSDISFIVCTSLLLWNSVFFLQSHKEERFMFPCYPFIGVASSLFVFGLVESSKSDTKRKWIKHAASFTTFVLCSLIFLMTISRIFTLVRWYSSPMFLVRHLPVPSSPSNKPLLCIGREWHYFPSRFLLPGGAKNWRVGFVQSAFAGQLPGQFAKPLSSGAASSSTRIDGNRFNSENLEETDRFITNESNECSFMLDRDSPPGVREKLYVADREIWFSLVNRTVLEPNNCITNATLFGLDLIFNCHFLRIFYVPILSEKVDHKINLHILARNSN